MKKRFCSLLCAAVLAFSGISELPADAVAAAVQTERTGRICSDSQTLADNKKVKPAACASDITEEIPVSLMPFGQKSYYPDAAIVSMVITNPAVASAVYSEEQNLFTIIGLQNGYTDITVTLANGAVYLFHVTVGGAPVTTTAITTAITTSTTVTTSAATEVTTKTTTTVTTAVATTAAPQETIPYVYGFDTWGFLNTKQNVGKLDSASRQYLYFLTDADRDLLFRKLSNIEIEKIGSKLGTRTRGACFGMASTSILQAYGYFKADDFFENTPNIGAITSKQVQSSDSLKSAINYYHMLQFSKAVVQRTHAMERMSEDVKLKMLIDALKAGRPALVGYNFEMQDGSRAGHAVVAYGIRTGMQMIVRLSANEHKQFDTEILLYNNDCPNDSEIYNLLVNTHTWEWCIQMTEQQDELNSMAIMNLSNHRSGNIALIIDDVELLNYHGKFSGNETYQFDRDVPYYASMNLHMTASNYKLNTAADPYDGSFNAGTDNGDIRFSASFYGDEDEGVAESSMDNDNSYYIEMSKPGPAELSMEYQNCLLQIKAASAKRVTVSPKARIALKGSEGDYELSMVMDEGYHETEWHKLIVRGSDSGDILLTNDPERGGFLLCGTALKNITVQANNYVHTAQAKFSTSYQKVLIYEIDADTVGIKADTDGDGKFETPLDINAAEADTRGDVDGDGEATATDAQMVLVAYTESLASGKQELTGEKFTAADVDKDGTVTAADAQYILIYFVQRSVVGDPKTWDELIKVN